MGSPWHIVAFPVILPWREEFWTLPLYLPDLKVGVIPGWPEQLPYQGMPLPPEAEVHPRELEHYQPGDLRQWRAFADYRRDQEDAGENMLQAIRGYGQPGAPEAQPPSSNAWSLAWQLEKMQADQDAQLLLVDKGQDWLQDIFKPEPWGEREAFEPAPGVPETVDPELALMRYRLWRRALAPFLQTQSVPVLLGRTSRAIFLTLKGWPDWTALEPFRLSLPGCRNSAEWRTVCGDGRQAAVAAAVCGSPGGPAQRGGPAPGTARRLGKTSGICGGGYRRRLAPPRGVELGPGDLGAGCRAGRRGTGTVLDRRRRRVSCRDKRPAAPRRQPGEPPPPTP